MMRDPALTYLYNFIYPQSFCSGLFKGSTDVCNKITRQLTGFASGSLVSISLFLAVKETPGAPTKNPLHFVKMSNVELFFNGQQIYRADDCDSEYFCLAEGLTNCSNEYTVLLPNDTTTALISHYTDIVFSQYNEKSIQSLIQAGINISSQVLEVRFNTPNPSQSQGIIDQDTDFTLFANYNYQAQIETRNMNAQIKFL
jgi:hypothetical protein